MYRPCWYAEARGHRQTSTVKHEQGYDNEEGGCRSDCHCRVRPAYCRECNGACMHVYEIDVVNGSFNLINCYKEALRLPFEWIF
jgi:hypothetical protein